jgi:tryptophan-rich sensory protein
LTRRDLTSLGAFLGLNYAVATVGALLTARSVETWYRGLNKPSWTPPDRVFGPVWTTLYATIGLAGWLAWRRPSSRGRSTALTAYAAQLGLNLAWSGLFFGLRSPALGLAGIVGLRLAIAWTMAAFWRISRPAALLLLPYLACVSFAARLNLAVWRMNPTRGLGV